tara:strand:+ start:82063 stop:82812 length:750 start_codon:yes stop_codon:yes gene_type:complete
MKMVEKSKSQVWLPFGCVLFCLGCFANVFVPEVAQGAFVTKTIQFNESDGFAISGTSITASGEAQYVIEGMSVGISTGIFLYPQQSSGEWWSDQPIHSTSLGSQAAGTGPIEFSLTLDSPTPGQTFDMESITLLGYSEPSTTIEQTVRVTFTGTKIVNGTMSSVTWLSDEFEADELSPLVITFDDEFHGLTSLAWSQGGTARAHQFDNITFSTVTAVPEPGTFLAMIALTTMGFVTRGRRWIGKRLQVV